jgi:hypothetical protein
MKIVSKQGPGGFTNAEDKFIEKFNEQINHMDLTTSSRGGLQRMILDVIPGFKRK